jgi:ribosomal-protein-alanine N-acetyltransferase
MSPCPLEQATVDFNALSRLHADGFNPPWSAAALSELLAGPGCFGFLVGADIAPDGFIIARIAADEADILTMVVSRKHRRSGLGRALVVAAAARAGQRGAHAMFLEVDVSNAAARSLYEKIGFAVVGNRSAYYKSPKEPPRDALVLKSGLPLDGK